jgi:hypothetical protein
MGRIICVPTAVMPSRNDEAMKMVALGAAAEISRLAIRQQSISRISDLFSTRSPSGTRNSSPST